MKKVMIIALIMLIIIPAVSADEILYDEDLVQFIDTSSTGEIYSAGATGGGSALRIYFNDITLYPELSYIVANVPGNEATTLNAGRNEFEYVFNGETRPGVIYKAVETNLLGQITRTRLTIFLNNWDIGSLTGQQEIALPFNRASTFKRITSEDSPVYISSTITKHSFDGTAYYTVASSIPWKNHLTIIEESQLRGYNIDLERTILGDIYTSTFNCTLGDTLLFTNTGHGTSVNVWYPQGDIDTVTVTNPQGINYVFPLESGGGPDDPNDPTPQPTLRTGTVTMTDNNGTTITGFEVTAVNHYTGQSYTVSTETDVVVMTLPMDRTIKIRNPRTGEYEEAPIGYYRFFGQSPGYKMLYEEGIQVSVMPEKYGSYQLCDILVTQESGYLTGKHQFQIRSRSDNSILQTGTISAKSATTGEWYNSTVIGGIASLILPYDTSNTQSQYAGNYYVYATSPGYKDSDYGTQIVVMPHTVSEIHNILLTPIGGIPPAGNVTLRIQVFSETGPGVRNAEIFIAGVLGEGASLWDTYTASSTGYLTVSVPGNSTYDIVASGAGYYDSARRVEVFTEDPVLIEIKLYLSGAPTPTVEPTTQPTGWVTPTPTQTTPPSQEDNLIGLSVKGLAKGFGIDYDTALLLFGLMIVFGAGGIVMNSVKGGAMEFIAGSIVGTFVAFALGLIPIWIFIIIAVVFGAYVLRVFVQGGQ